MNKKKSMNYLVQAAVIAALYAALTYLASVFGLAYGNVQFRFSEALTILAAYTPAAIPGLTIGCFIANLGTPYGMIDIVCGTAATLLAALLSYSVRNVKIKDLPVLAPLFPVITNAVIVGAELAIWLPEGATFAGFLVQAAWVGLGEAVVCFGGGLPLAAAINNIGVNRIFKK